MINQGNTIHTRCCSFLFACLIGITPFHRLMAQSDTLRSIKQTFEQYRKKAFQEKIYVHTDKQFYVAGEILWFKIYDVDGTIHHPIDISKVAYVEIINDAQLPELQVKVAMDNGTGNGSLFLPLALASGNYRMRVYTNWMKNFTPAGYFEKVITIVNTQEPAVQPAATTTPAYTAQFFPEGGHLVTGLQSTLAFRITDNTGKGIHCKGVIIDEKGDSITSFQPLKFGIGRCSFTPTATHTYKAKITPEKGKSFTQELPQANEQGYVMQVSDTGKDQIKVLVTASRTNNGASATPVYLFIHTRQEIKVADMKDLQHGQAVFLVDKKILGEGISHFTIFNSFKQPVCERLYFKPLERQLAIIARAEKEKYAQRTKVNIPVQTKNMDGEIAAADMSVSVYLADSLQKAPEENMLTYLWLSSDLQGSVESPEYYFTSDLNVPLAIDNLMLTHGWRKFRWDDILQRKTPMFKYVPEYTGHIITGTVIDIATGKLVNKPLTTHLSAPGKWWYYYPASSEPDGRVKYYTRGLYDTREIVVQVGEGKDSIHGINIDNPFSTLPSPDTILPFNVRATLSSQLETHSLSMQTMRMYLDDSLKKTIRPPGDTLPFYGKSDWDFNLDDYTRFTTMEEVLREFVIPVDVRRLKGHFYLRLKNQPFNEYFNNDPLMLLDGVPVFSSDELMAINPLKVKRVEVVTKPYFYGATTSSGIISLTTYNGNLDGIKPDPHMVVLDYEGLQQQRQFYSPTYNTSAEKESSLPDLRNLLYWAPVVKTSTKDSTEISFYTGDQPGKYIVVLQGITSDGLVGCRHFTFEVLP